MLGYSGFGSTNMCTSFPYMAPDNNSTFSGLFTSFMLNNQFASKSLSCNDNLYLKILDIIKAREWDTLMFGYIYKITNNLNNKIQFGAYAQEAKGKAQDMSGLGLYDEYTQNMLATIKEIKSAKEVEKTLLQQY